VNVTRILLQAVPPLIGAFAGAPLLARELETGTFRFAWTQGFGRWRWTLAKLVLLAVAVAAAAAAFSALFSWYLSPFSAAGYTIPFATDIFDLREVAFAGWTLAAFAIGALAGMLTRRVVPAIAATLAVYLALALATALWLRQHYITPVLTSKLNLPASSWIINQWYTRDGKFAFGNRGAGIISAIQRYSCTSAQLSPTQCLTRHGYAWQASYQPGSRFWSFQWIEGGWLLALSLLLLAATIWVVRRRAA
jgi:ABC-2 family transporter protein